VELALRITPVRGETEPGAPMPIDPRPPACCSVLGDQVADRLDGRVVGSGIGRAHAASSRPSWRQGGGLDLRAAKINADPNHGARRLPKLDARPMANGLLPLAYPPKTGSPRDLEKYFCLFYPEVTAGLSA
jgi:hypothetical protein